MFWGCFAARGTGVLKKIGGIKNYVDILKVHPEVLSLEAKAGTPMDLSAGQWP